MTGGLGRGRTYNPPIFHKITIFALQTDAETSTERINGALHPPLIREKRAVSDLANRVCHSIPLR